MSPDGIYLKNVLAISTHFLRYLQRRFMDSVVQRCVILKIMAFIMDRRRKNVDSLNEFGKFYLIFYLIVSIALNNKFVREVYISESVT